LYRKSIHKIQNNSTKRKINKYIDFLMRGIEKKDYVSGSMKIEPERSSKFAISHQSTFIIIISQNTEGLEKKCNKYLMKKGKKRIKEKEIKKKKEKKEKGIKKRKKEKGKNKKSQNQSNLDFVPKLKSQFCYARLCLLFKSP